MGFVTVLVQHAWAMAPNPNGRNENESKQTNKQLSNRVSIPSTVAQFVKSYNHNVRQYIRQPNSSNQQQLQVSQTNATNLLHQLDQLSQRTDLLCASGQRIISHCRRSMLALTRCKDVRGTLPGITARGSIGNEMIAFESIRDWAFKVLREALEVGKLITNDEEVACLLLLVNEIGLVWESEARRAERKWGCAVGEDLERLLICLALTLQRLEYAFEIKSFVVPQLVQTTMLNLVQSIKKYNPVWSTFVEFTTLNIFDMISFLTSPRLESEESMASQIAVSLVSQVMRQVPIGDISKLTTAFCEIIEDLAFKKQYHLGSRFLKLVATSAIFQIDAAQIFQTVQSKVVDLVSKYPDTWRWAFHSFIMSSVIALCGDTSGIRKTVLEKCLLKYSESNIFSHLDKRTPGILRFAVKISLLHVTKSCEDSVTKLLADEALRSMGEFVVEQVWISKLFKETSILLAESYAESENRYVFLRKYLRSTQRRTHIRNYRGRNLNFNRNLLARKENKELENLKRLDDGSLWIKPYHMNFSKVILDDEKDNELKKRLNNGEMVPSFLETMQIAAEINEKSIKMTDGTANCRKIAASKRK
ncbi:hypothetical protein HK096_007537 [Nowakowskiella sp. JEL0078]|nr:hypothetical protein HK096_007537 [Nowakowskiella sp. JEL0078]